MKLIITILISIALVSCGNDAHDHSEEGHSHEEELVNAGGDNHDDHGDGNENIVEIYSNVYETMGVKLDSLSSRNMSEAVYATGHLRVPPSNEATATAMVGANIKSIRIIEGEKVRKGQTLVTLEHPNLIEIQTKFVELASNLDYLKTEFEREEKLYNADASSGKSFQKSKSDYLTTKARYNGQKKMLKMLNINTDKVLEGEISDMISVRSPIEGYVNKIAVKTGQYINPNDVIVDIVNNHHVHVDLMVFEKDAMKVKIGQEVRFTTEFLPGEEFMAKIISVGKSFEEEPKAIHIHAEISDNKEGLIPGIYVKGSILIDLHEVRALPEAAVISDKGKSYIFTYVGSDDEHTMFERVEVKTGIVKDGWIEIAAVVGDADLSKIVYNKAYSLQAEKDKGAGGGHHH